MNSYGTSTFQEKLLPEKPFSSYHGIPCNVASFTCTWVFNHSAAQLEYNRPQFAQRIATTYQLADFMENLLSQLI